MDGYYERPDLNAKRQRVNWHHTNDLARREDNGALTWLGSMDRLIKSGSENIYPAEVEACIRTHPAVVDCAVVGQEHDSWGQVVKARVVLTPGSAVTASAIVAHCRGRIAPYKTPRLVEFVREIAAL